MNPTFGALIIYPLRGQGGVLLVLWTVGIYVLLALFDGSRTFAAWHALMTVLLPVAWTLAFGVFQHYAWATLRHVAAGNTQTIRSIDIEEVSPLTNYLSFQVALLLLGVFVGLAWCYSVSPLLGTGVVVGLGVVLPAALAVVVLDERIWPGFNPARLWRFAADLGAPYVLFAAAMYVGIATLYAACIAMSPPAIAAVFAASYVFVLGHVLAGRVLYVYRDRLDLVTSWDVEAKEQAVETATAEAIDALMEELHRLCGADHLDRANKKLEGFLRQRNYTIDERIHQRLRAFQDNRLLLEHSWHYLDRLVVARKFPRAWLLLRNALIVDPLFRPSTADAMMALIAVAPPADAEYVDMLLGDFERAFPTSERLPEALFEHARWSFMQLGRTAAALEMLRRIERQFPRLADEPRFAALYTRVRRSN